MTDIDIQRPKVHEEETTRPGRTYVPNVDILETADAIRLWADMPGVGEDAIDVHLDDGVLTIEGRVSLEPYQDLTPAYTEYNVGNFVRRFTISAEIDGERIHGRMTNGVLELELPKSERAKPRRIKIQAR